VDIPVASIVIGVLIGACILGIVAVTVSQPGSLNKLGQILCLSGILGILVVVQLVVWLVRLLSRKTQGEEGTPLGKKIAIFLGIVWLAGCALVVLFFVSCAVSFR